MRCVSDCCRISKRVIFREGFPSLQDTWSGIDQGAEECRRSSQYYGMANRNRMCYEEDRRERTDSMKRIELEVLTHPYQTRSVSKCHH